MEICIEPHVASKRAEPRETEKPQSASPGKPRPLRCRSSGEPSVSINPKAAMQGPFEWQAPEGSIINRQALRQRWRGPRFSWRPGPLAVAHFGTRLLSWLRTRLTSLEIIVFIEKSSPNGRTIQLSELLLFTQSYGHGYYNKYLQSAAPKR